jgi:dethiobiotin synthetase
MKRRSILYVTGTDTGVGKTVLSVLLTRRLLSLGLDVWGLKPVVSGGREDARLLHGVQGGGVPLEVVNPWHFRAALAPPLAARRQGVRVELDAVVGHVRSCVVSGRALIVEGAGGLLSPLGEGFDSRDLIRALRAIPVIVAANRLGAVHQVRAVLAGLPRWQRVRAVVVLSGEKKGAAAASNAALLLEFEPGLRLVELPWVERWQGGGELGGAVGEALDQVAKLAGWLGD